jgi:hypothetical protein
MVDEGNVMKIDEYDFERTAQAVYIMNDSARDQYDSWEDLQSFMINMAYTYCHESNSFSTGGFNLTAYNSPDGERVVRAGVSSYVALQYVKRMEKMENA